MEAIRFMKIVEELIEIWPNEVCNTYTLFSLWTIVQSVTQSLNTLAYDITSLKTLTRPFVKEHEDIKC